MNVIHNREVIDWCKGCAGEKFHALLCDPPYEIGFMGKAFDKTGISFRKETWHALGEHLYPGAFGMAFASSRGWHRLAVAIEDGGFIIHPTIFGWATAQGFPKATRIDTQIDRNAGEEREVVYRGDEPGREGRKSRKKMPQPMDWGNDAYKPDEFTITAPATDLAKAWEGHRYGLQALSPSLEPIIVFQKPYEGRPLDNITETGAGALWIDGARIGNEERTYRGSGAQPNKLNNHGSGDTGIGLMDGSGMDMEFTAKGRWPKNLLLLDDGAAEALDRQSGVTKTKASPANTEPSEANSQIYGFAKYPQMHKSGAHYDGEGGASRFFFRVREQLDEADPVRYVPKASKRERDAGCDGMEEKEAQERNSYAGLPDLRMNHKQNRIASRNHHPTVKPLALTEYLARLLLPPSAYAPRRLLVPFCGSGSEMIGGHLAGWEEITGIDTEAEYCTIANARLAYWCKPAEQDFLFTL